MEDTIKKVDIDKVLSFANDCLLNVGNGGDNLAQYLEYTKSLRSFCEINARETNLSLKGYQKRINGCKEKIEKVNGDVVTDSNLDDIQTQLKEKIHMEFLLREQLREDGAQLESLEQQRISFENRWQLVKQRKKQVQRLKNSLSMCASVTGITFENVDRTKISGFITDRIQKKVERFEVDPAMPQFDACNGLWDKVSH